MGINIWSRDGQVAQEVDPTHFAARVSVRPQEVSAWSSLGAITGLVTGLASGAALFSLRNVGAAKILLRRFQLSWMTTVLGTAGRFDFALNIARNFTVSDSGGNDASVTARHRLALAAPNIAARIASTAALTAGTRTLDGVAGVIGYWSAAIGSQLPLTALLSHDTGDHPIVLNPNEGVILTAPAVPAATAVSVGYVQAEFAEAASYP